MTRTPEQREIGTLARDVAQRELLPGASERDGADADATGVLAALAELGFFSLSAPESGGGLGLDTSTALIAVEELARGDAGVALVVGLHNALLPFALDRGATATGVDPERLLSGEVLASVSPGWLFTGRRGGVFPAAGAATLAMDAAPTDSSQPSWRILERDEADSRRVPGLIGLRSARLISLENPEPGGSAVGTDEPDGSALRSRVRLVLAACGLGIGTAANRAAVAYSGEREQFGRSIGSFGAVQAKIGETIAGLAAARSVTYHAAEVVSGTADQPEWSAGPEESWGPGSSALLASILSVRAASRATDEAVQIFGGYGYMREYPVERWMRDAQALALLGDRIDGAWERLAVDVVNAGSPVT